MNELKSITAPKRTLIVSRVPQNSDFDSEFHSYFEDPEKYLKLNPYIVVGKVIRGPRTTQDMKIIPHSIVGSVTEFEEGLALKNNQGNTLKYSAKMSCYFPPIKKDDKVKKSNYEPVDEIKLNAVFKKYQNLKMINEDKINEIFKEMPENLAYNLKLQEKKLNKFKNDEIKFNNLVKTIAKKTKKSEDQVLMTIPDNKRLKTEYNELMDSKKRFEDKYSRYNWNFSLRRPENFIGTRHSLVNIGNEYKPLWVDIKETVPKSIEIIRKPTVLSHSKSNSRHSRLSSRFMFDSMSINNYDINKLDELKGLQLEGSDLLKLERDATNSMTGKKILYRKEYLETIETSESGHKSTVDFTSIKPDKNIQTEQTYISNYGNPPSSPNIKKTHISTYSSTATSNKYRTVV